MGFGAQVKLFPLEKTLGTIDQTLKIFEAHLVTRGPKADYRIFNNFSPHDMKVIPRKVCEHSNGISGILVSLDSEIIGDLQYPESKEFLLSLKSFSFVQIHCKTCTYFSAASLVGVVTFVTGTVVDACVCFCVVWFEAL